MELNESSFGDALNTRSAGDSDTHPRTRIRPALALGAAAFALVFAITSGAGPGLDPDAMGYLGAATSLAQQGTLRIPSSQWDAEDSTSALTTWPPAFSIAMAVPRVMGVSPLISSRIVNSLAAFVTAAFLFFLFDAAVGAAAAVSGVAGVFVTTAVVSVHLSVLSEPLFLASLVLTLWVMAGRETRPIIAGMPAALAAMTRYAGVCAPAAVVLWFFFTGTKSIRVRIMDAAKAALIPAIVIAGWLLRSVIVGDRSGSPELSVYGNFGVTFNEATRTFADWLAPGMDPPALQLAIAVALAGGIVLVFVKGIRRCSARARALLKADALLLSCYIFVLMSARVLVGSAIPFDFRLLVPAILLAEVTIVVTVSAYLSGAGVAARRTVIATCVLWFGASLAQSARDAREAVTEGSDFASSEWRSSPTLEWVRSRSAGWTLFSNWPAAIYFRTPRIARDMPQTLDSTDLKDFAEILADSHGALVAFSSRNPDYVPGDSIAQALGLVKVAQLGDGVVWASPKSVSR